MMGLTLEQVLAVGQSSQQGGQQQGEQQVDKVLGGKPLVKCPGAHLGVLGQHSEEELLDVRPGPLHSTLAGVQFLLGKAESVDGEKARVGLAALLQPLKQPCHAGEQVRKGPGVLGKAEDLLPNALHRGGHQLGLGAETVIDRPHRDPAAAATERMLRAVQPCSWRRVLLACRMALSEVTEGYMEGLLSS